MRAAPVSLVSLPHGMEHACSYSVRPHGIRGYDTCYGALCPVTATRGIHCTSCNHTRLMPTGQRGGASRCDGSKRRRKMLLLRLASAWRLVRRLADDRNPTIETFSIPKS